MAPALITTLVSHLTPRAAPPSPNPNTLGPLAAASVLLARDGEYKNDPHTGVTEPQDISNKAIFALFGLIGVAFVCVGIWFFFWAKNGGFYFKQNDWDDYKTTVLRRRGPNGTLLSGATPSTNLGGGSIYKDMDDDRSTTDGGTATVISGTTAMTGITAGVSDISSREKRRKKREAKDREKERRREEKARDKEDKKNRKNAPRKVGADGVIVDDEAEAEAKAHLRNYRHERPARVGGLNKESEASTWDGSTQPSQSTATDSSVTSDLMSHREKTPTNTPTKGEGKGIRKVYSAAERSAERETERIRAEARRLQERGRAAGAGAGGRRDFSWQKGGSDAPSSRGDAETHVPGSWTESNVGSDVGTKSYRHVIPGLSGSDRTDFAYEERRKKRATSGYRRDQ